MLESVDSVDESRTIQLGGRPEPLVTRGPADLRIGKRNQRAHPIDIARHQELVAEHLQEGEVTRRPSAGPAARPGASPR